MSLAAVLSVTRLAAASPSAAERETARRFMDEGKARLNAEEVGRAIEAFRKAHDIMHVPTTGMALARAHLAAGHLVEARELALEVGRMPRNPGDPPVFDAARKQARELVAQLEARMPTVRIKIKGGPAARVAVDDVEVPPSAIGEPVAVNPGKRVFSVRNAEGREAKETLEVAERDAKEIELVLPASANAAGARASSPEGAGTAPRALRVESFGNDDVDRAGERTPLAEVLVYGGLGLGVVGLGVGAVTGAMTFSRASDVEPQCENGICAPSAKGDLDSANTFATVSTIAFVAGGVGVVAGAVGWLLPRRPTARASTRAAVTWDWTGALRRSSDGGTITVGPTGAGIGGTFQ